MTAFDALFVPAALREAVSGPSWLAAMLDVERALANGGAEAGIVPAASARMIAEACVAEGLEWDEIVDRGRVVGSPVEPVVRAVRERVGLEHERFVHVGATSQDVIDTAAVLVSRAALELVLRELERLAGACAGLARAHRSTPMAARTLLQQAVPTTFGLVAAGWLVAVLDARRWLREARERLLVVQLGGAAGTLSALGDDGLRLVELVAEELGLSVPTLPWHTNRVRVAELGAALGATAGVCGKIGLDVVLLAQSEVGEVREAGGGGSTAMPQKRNPVRAMLARASSRLAAGHASVLQATLEQEHQRAAGAWQAEWESICGALAYSGGSAASAADALENLEVDAGRMRANLDAGGGLLMAERVALTLGKTIGRGPANDVLEAASIAEVPFRDALLADARTGLNAEELDRLLDPETYLGSATALVDRALARYAEESS